MKFRAYVTTALTFTETVRVGDGTFEVELSDEEYAAWKAAKKTLEELESRIRAQEFEPPEF